MTLAYTLRLTISFLALQTCCNNSLLRILLSNLRRCQGRPDTSFYSRQGSSWSLAVFFVAFQLIRCCYPCLFHESWQDLEFTLTKGKKKPGKRILKGVSGHLYPNEICAIMGGSGAGKLAIAFLSFQASKSDA